MKSIRHLFEAACLLLLFIVFKLIGLDASSAIGGWLGKTIGPHLPSTKKAQKNMRLALPGKSEEDYKSITMGMWDNLGRVFAEFPHLEKIGRDRTEIVNGHILDRLKNDGLPGILISAHIANWEVLCASFLRKGNFPIYGVYRDPNNPWVAKIVHRARSYDVRVPSFPKTRAGMRLLIQTLKDGHHIGIMIDQKYNRGAAVPFLGRPAMTAPTFAQLAVKFNCPLVSARIERLQGAHFRVTLYEPLKLHDENGAPLPVETIIAAAHAHLEEWIRERPEQWLWIHRRWDSAAFQSA